MSCEHGPDYEPKALDQLQQHLLSLEQSLDVSQLVACQKQTLEDLARLTQTELEQYLPLEEFLFYNYEKDVRFRQRRGNLPYALETLQDRAKIALEQGQPIEMSLFFESWQTELTAAKENSKNHAERALVLVLGLDSGQRLETAVAQEKIEARLDRLVSDQADLKADMERLREDLPNDDIKVLGLELRLIGYAEARLKDLDRSISSRVTKLERAGWRVEDDSVIAGYKEDQARERETILEKQNYIAQNYTPDQVALAQKLAKNSETLIAEIKDTATVVGWYVRHFPEGDNGFMDKAHQAFFDIADLHADMRQLHIDGQTKSGNLAAYYEIVDGSISNLSPDQALVVLQGPIIEDLVAIQARLVGNWAEIYQLDVGEKWYGGGSTNWDAYKNHVDSNYDPLISDWDEMLYYKGNQLVSEPIITLMTKALPEHREAVVERIVKTDMVGVLFQRLTTRMMDNTSDETSGSSQFFGPGKLLLFLAMNFPELKSEFDRPRFDPEQTGQLWSITDWLNENISLQEGQLQHPESPFYKKDGIHKGAQVRYLKRVALALVD